MNTDRIKRVIRQCEQIIRDIEWWNTHRTDTEPLDCEPERVMLSIARPCLEAMEAGDSERAHELSLQLRDYAEQLLIDPHPSA